MSRPCPDMQDKTVDFMLGGLDAPGAQAVQEHLDRCPACRQYLQDLREQGEALLGLGREIGAGMDARQVRVIEALEKASPVEAGTGRVFLLLGGFLKMAVAAVLVLGAGIVIGRRTAPGAVDVEQLRAQVQASVTAALQPAVRESLLVEVDRHLQAGLSARDEELRTELVEQVRRDLRALALQLAANSQRLVDERFAEVVQLVEAARRTDRVQVAKALEQIALRTGLGFQTLAARANNSPDMIEN
jgi:anti-sigma factor RsiW